MKDPTKETRAEFEERYASGSRWPMKWEVDYLSLPCTCDDGGGPTHWAAIRNTPEMIELHKEDEQLRAEEHSSVGGVTKTEYEEWIDAMPDNERSRFDRFMEVSGLNDSHLKSKSSNA